MKVNRHTAGKRTIITKGAIILALLTFAAFTSVALAGTYSGGSGTEADPYLISTAVDMQSIGANEDDWDKHFVLTADIDLLAYTGSEFNIIGYYKSYYDKKPFRGVFDGNEHIISNFTYTTTDNDNIGLFGYVYDVNAVIKDLTLVDPDVNAAGYSCSVGCLVGMLEDGTVSGCAIEGGNVSGSGSTAGLVGCNYNGTISNCYAMGNVTAEACIGGLVGANFYGTISNCYAAGSVSGTDITGGLMGENWGGTISNCYAEGSVTGYGYTGGLAGTNEGTISNCYAVGSVTGVWYTGGLVGGNGGTISNCYTTSDVTGDKCTGGLVGENWGAIIENCYAAGSVTGDENTGGLAGSKITEPGWEGISGCFWDIETTGQSSSAGGEGKATAEMKTATTFIYAGWSLFDNEGVWTIDEGNDYPRLSWQNLPGQPLPSFYELLEGTGTADDPYLVHTGGELNLIGLVESEWDKHYRLTADIDLSGYTGTEFNLIGYFDPDNEPHEKPFSGVFDGNGHTISNFTYETDNYCEDIGLFRCVHGPNAVIKDLTLVDPNVNAGSYSFCVGSLVGWLKSGTIAGCGVEGGSITGYWATGELVGSIMKARFQIAMQQVALPEMTTPAGWWGATVGMISDCYAAGTVTGTDWVGGLVGYNHYGTIFNCYAAGMVTGNFLSRWVGGLAGCNPQGTISYCYADSSVEARERTGGLVGGNGGTISNSYATGSVTGHFYTGGLAGSNFPGTIINCYATGGVTGHNYTGGLVGYSFGLVDNCFWDIDTSGQSSSAGGEGKTTAEMQMQSTFTNAGWDFVTPIWKICEAVDYPRLWWETMDWPVIDEEPDMTTGTSNTISWQEVDEASEYYAICCSDDNLENVVAESGWVDVNEYTFDGLETGRTYWYAVKARQNCVLESEWSDVVGSMQVTLSDIVEIMLDPDSLKNSNMKNALMNKIEEVLEMIDAGLYEDALKKLENDILKKTDGCFNSGQVDKNDWITTCEAQQQIYPFVIETIDYVNSLME